MLAFSALPTKFWFRGSTEAAEKEKREVRAQFPIFVGILALVLIGFTVDQAVEIGELDAEVAARESPRAIVRFEYSEIPALSHPDPEICPNHPLDCILRVVLVGDEFVYLNLAVTTFPMEGLLYAVPASDIVSIIYLRNSR